MTEDEFTKLFDANDLNDLATVTASVDAEHATTQESLKSGVWYSYNEENSNGHTLSIYRLNLGGKTIAWILIDNDIEVSKDIITAQAGELPPYVTAHHIVIANAQRNIRRVTGGFALRYPQSSGTHIDTNTVRAYVMPRLAKVIAQLYGI